MQIAFGILIVTIAAFLYNRNFTSKQVEINNSYHMTARFIKNANPFPSYFFSHGGPTFMYETDTFGDKGAWKTIKKLGSEIKNEWKPDYIIVVSAHWQSSLPNLVEISIPKNDSSENPLIYDFYGFPKHMYQEEFHSKNSAFVAQEIKNQLELGGFNSSLTKRGIDHGVWVPFKVAFSDYNTQSPVQPDHKSLDLPDTSVIQVSLTSSEQDFTTHYKLGEILSKFRDNQIWDEKRQQYLKGMIICSGMSVHNLGDIRYGLNPRPYASQFNELLTNTLTNSPNILQSLLSLQTIHKSLLKQAHPTLEHFVPVVVASGTLDSHTEEKVKELYNSELGSLGWGIYQFGDDYKL